MQTIIQMAKGNPGALSFILELAKPTTPMRTMGKIYHSGIVGTDLYVLWCDLCDRDMEKVVQLVDNCPLDILKDACSRQDYSGRKLVSQYLQKEETETES